MGVLDKISQDVFFSIYQDPKYSKDSFFSMQQVSRRKYYSNELAYLVDKIEGTTDPIESEKLIDRFQNFVANRKKELISLYNQSLSREKTNQRIIYVLLDRLGVAVHNKKTSDLVYLGGPLGGGIMQLNESLNKVQQMTELSLIEIDSNDVGLEVDEITVELEFDSFTIRRSDYEKFDPSIFPIENDLDYFILKRATKYFEEEYQRLSMINDFAPMVDLAIEAAQANFSANFIYFVDFPDLITQKFDQYSLNKENYHPNFLSITRLFDLPLNKRKNIVLKGFGFVENGEEYGLVISEMYSGLRNIVLAQAPFPVVLKFSEEVVDHNELKLQIFDIKKSAQSINRLAQRNQIGMSPVMRELVGVSRIKSRIFELRKNIQTFELPFGYVSINFKEEMEFLKTSFSEIELPKEYITILLDLKNSLELLRSGPLDTLSFSASTVSAYVQSGQELVKIEYIYTDTDRFDIVVYMVGSNFDDVKSRFQNQNWTYSEKMLQNIKLPLDKETLQMVKEELGISQTIPYSLFESVNNDLPMTSYISSVLGEFTVPVLLKRVLREVRETEEGRQEIEFVQPNSYELMEEMVSTNESELDEYLKARMEIMAEDNNMLYRTQKLEEHINHFNTGLFTFISNMLRREEIYMNHSSADFYEKVENLFHDITIALIDFGLRPAQWKIAENLQLWNSYQAQIGYIEHNIIMDLREIIGEGYEGEDLDLLISHRFTKFIRHQSLHGHVSGDKYLQLKKVHLSFIPKIRQFSDSLVNISSINELVAKLEEFEAERRKKVQSQLPKLPGVN